MTVETHTAPGSRLTHGFRLGREPINLPGGRLARLRYTPIADQIPHRSELTLRANSGSDIFIWLSSSDRNVHPANRVCRSLATSKRMPKSHSPKTLFEAASPNR